MPKIKSNSGASKRFKLTGSGKVKHKQAGKSHLLTHKTRARKRHLKGPRMISKADEQSIKRLLPYS